MNALITFFKTQFVISIFKQQMYSISYKNNLQYVCQLILCYSDDDAGAYLVTICTWQERKSTTACRQWLQAAVSFSLYASVTGIYTTRATIRLLQEENIRYVKHFYYAYISCQVTYTDWSLANTDASQIVVGTM